MTKELQDYRSFLISAEQKAQDDFDKAVLTLSGGALGISFAFVKDIVGMNPINNSSLLYCAWIFWGFSIVAALVSYFTSGLALRKAIKQYDEGKIYTEHVGGLFDSLTALFNIVGVSLFILGVISITFFVKTNLGV